MLGRRGRLSYMLGRANARLVLSVLLNELVLWVGHIASPIPLDHITRKDALEIA